MTGKTWRWLRRAKAGHEHAWRDVLVGLGPERLVIHGRPGGRMIRLEIYDTNAAALRRLAAAFGGKVECFDVEAAAAHANAPRRPLYIGNAVGILDEHGAWPSKRPRPDVILHIAGAMAFGTGEHATTAGCLRFLAHEATRCAPGWKCLDLGTGSGILAIAAEKFGAAGVLAIDYDTRAVRAARTNTRRNRCRHVKVTAGDIMAWKPARAKYRVVLANMFSSVLCSAAARISQAVASDGCLILSGILRTQEDEVLRAFFSTGLRTDRAARRGKWVTLLLRPR